MKYNSIITIIGIYTLLISCDIKKSNITPDATFVKVYESGDITESYYPVSIVEMENKNGYLVLSALDDSSYTNFPKVNITALSPAGDLIATLTLPINYVNPVPDWLVINGNYYFICMDDVTLKTKRIEVTLNGGSIQFSEIQGIDELLPLMAWTDGTNSLLLSYDRIGWKSRIDLFDSNFNPQWLCDEDAKDDFEFVVRAHMQKTGNEFPFFAGSMTVAGGGKKYFVNCLANYTMTLLFLDGSSGAVTGRLYPYQDKTAISSAMYLENDTFAISRYHSGDNYVYPKVMLDANTTQNTNNFQDIQLSQLKSDAHMEIVNYTYNEYQLILYVSTTKSNQISLIFYNKLTGKQVYTHSLGYGNPVEVVQVIQTQDEGLAVLGKTWINERYQRIILYKVDKNQLDIKL